jgi:hypothetical protein
MHLIGCSRMIFHTYTTGDPSKYRDRYLRLVSLEGLTCALVLTPGDFAAPRTMHTVTDSQYILTYKHA